MSSKQGEMGTYCLTDSFNFRMKMIMRMDLGCHKTVRMSLMLLNYTWNGKFYVMYVLLKFKKVFTLKTAYLTEHHTSFSFEEERKNVGNHWQVRKKFLGVRFHYDCLLSKRVNCLENWSVERWDIQESWKIFWGWFVSGFCTK